MEGLTGETSVIRAVTQVTTMVQSSQKIVKYGEKNTAKPSLKPIS